jgi:hypothetical protein
MATADKDRVHAAVYALLGRPDQSVLPYNDVYAARIDAGMMILRAIASNPQHGEFGALATMVGVSHLSFLPSHSGKPGIPQIVPFAGGNARAGTPAKPDEIDSYRESPELYSGSVDGVVVAHDAKDVDNKMSPMSCKYSIVDEQLRFTGVSAEVPLIQLTRSMADNSVPIQYEPTLVKLIPFAVVTPKSEYFKLATALAADGKQDLLEISTGAMSVRAVRAVADIIAEQKSN